MIPSPTESLVQRIGDLTEPEDLLLCLYDWLSDQGIEPYSTQEEAFLELMQGHHVILQTPTGSGKSLVAICAHFLHLAKRQRSVYTSPIKALVNEKYRDLCDQFGDEKVGILTGDYSHNPQALILCCTAEVLASIGMIEGDGAGISCVIMDEFHYYGDKQRGMAWQLPLLCLKKTQFVLMSATLGDTSRLESKIFSLTQRTVKHIQSSSRPVPLSFEYLHSPLQESVESLVSSARTPCYLVAFSHNEVMQIASGLVSVAVIDKEQRHQLKLELKPFPFNTPFGKELKRLLLAGVGVHYAGMLPRYRGIVERLAQKGLLGVICGTDTLGVGINIPLKSVLFTKLCKFDGKKTRIIDIRAFHQIAGRAGRKGFDGEGFVFAQAPAHIIENERIKRKAEATGKKSHKVRLQKAPERGYVHWDEETFQTLIQSQCEPIQPVFKVDHGTIINAFKWAEKSSSGQTGYGRLIQLIADSDSTSGQKSTQRKRLKRLVLELIQAGIIVHQRRPAPKLQLRSALQDNFSIFSELTLFLIEVVDTLASSEDSSDIIGLIESIQENPTPILLAQRKRLRDEAVSAMKSEGVPYEERMEKLEQISWHTPPSEGELRHLFEVYQSAKPHLNTAHFDPKHITGLLLSSGASLSEFIRDYGLHRSEGLLLRYVNQTLKFMRQTIPPSSLNEMAKENITILESLIIQIDGSVMEAMTGPGTTESRAKPASRRLDEREILAFVRKLVLRSLNAWAAGRIAGMADLYTNGQHELLSESELRVHIERYEEQCGPFQVLHSMRDSSSLTLKNTDKKQWQFFQYLTTCSNDTDWYLKGRVIENQESDEMLMTLMFESIGPMD